MGGQHNELYNGGLHPDVAKHFRAHSKALVAVKVPLGVSFYIISAESSMVARKTITHWVDFDTIRDSVLLSRSASI
jgi:hypothetical protein